MAACHSGPHSHLTPVGQSEGPELLGATGPFCRCSKTSLRSALYSALNLLEERLAILGATLVVLDPSELLLAQGVQPAGYLPNRLLVVVGDRDAAVLGSGGLYDPGRLFGDRSLGIIAVSSFAKVPPVCGVLLPRLQPSFRPSRH